MSHWHTMETAPADGTPVMLRVRDSIGQYEAGPFAWINGEWRSVGGRYSHPFVGKHPPIAWREHVFAKTDAAK